MAAPGPDKTLCGAQRANQAPGVTCGRSAGHGTDHLGVGRCSRHGGNTPSHAAAAINELARRACTTLGVSVEQHPAEALLGEVFRTRGAVDFYEALVQELPTHPEDGKAGVYGPTYHQSGIPTGEAKPHILVQLWMQERKHLVDATTAALKAGVDAKRLQIEEDKAALFADVLRSFAVELGHDPASEPVRRAFRAGLSVIAGGRAA